LLPRAPDRHDVRRVKAAICEPGHVNTTTAGHRREQRVYDYPDRYLYSEDGRLVAMQVRK
jgi:hypothetical protein